MTKGEIQWSSQSLRVKRAIVLSKLHRKPNNRLTASVASQIKYGRSSCSICHPHHIPRDAGVRTCLSARCLVAFSIASERVVNGKRFLPNLAQAVPVIVG